MFSSSAADNIETSEIGGEIQLGHLCLLVAQAGYWIGYGIRIFTVANGCPTAALGALSDEYG